MVVLDFFCCCLAPLQARLHPVWLYTGDDDATRLARGVMASLNESALSHLMKLATGVSDLAVVIIPDHVVPLCGYAGREAIFVALPQVDAQGLAVPPAHPMAVEGLAPEGVVAAKTAQVADAESLEPAFEGLGAAAKAEGGGGRMLCPPSPLADPQGGTLPRMKSIVGGSIPALHPRWRFCHHLCPSRRRSLLLLMMRDKVAKGRQCQCQGCCRPSLSVSAGGGLVRAPGKLPSPCFR